jgi:hypothetical protein
MAERARERARPWLQSGCRMVTGVSLIGRGHWMACQALPVLYCIQGDTLRHGRLPDFAYQGGARGASLSSVYSYILNS